MDRIYNEGERLIPGITHGVMELVRHRSSYLFFRQVIALDPGPRTILDLGCGVGHGCATLAGLPDTHVVGVDLSEDAIRWAQDHYAHQNVEYRVGDIATVLSDPFDYMVSRNSLEHIPEGLRLAAQANWRKRLLFDVPYNEPPGTNQHHVLHGVREEHLMLIKDAEIVYQDLGGTIHLEKPAVTNVIGCIASRQELPRVRDSLHFPVRAWKPSTRTDQARLWAERIRVTPHYLRRYLRA